jgi:lysophospholipase L1-like esterase
VPTGAAAATGFINVNRVASGTNTFVIGIAPRVAATKHIEIFNIAAGSLNAANVDISVDSTGDFTYAAVARRMLTDVPSLVIIDIGINNWRLFTLGSTDTTYQTVLANSVASAQSLGAEVILCKPVPSQIGYSATLTQANMDAYRAAIDAVAQQYGCIVYDKAKRFQSYAISNPLGYYNDGLHPVTGAYAPFGFDLAQIIMNA